LLQWLIIILIAITLILVAAFILWDYIDNKYLPNDPNEQAVSSVAGVTGKPLTAKEIVELTVKIEDITTNLNNRDFIRLSFAFLLENKKTKEDFENLDFMVKAIIIQTLNESRPEDILGKDSIDRLNATLMNKVNPILPNGKIRQVYVTNVLLQ
jgi:flagellar FliL protein